jgi:membrane protease YdiL (CAAX protease family)
MATPTVQHHVPGSCRRAILVGLGAVTASFVAGWFSADSVGWVTTMLVAAGALYACRSAWSRRDFLLAPASSRPTLVVIAITEVLAVIGFSIWCLLDFHSVDSVTAGARADSLSELLRILGRIIVVTALLEELIFRGALWAAFRRCGHRAGAGLAVVASAALYGLWHIGPTIHAERAMHRAPSLSAILASVATTFLLGLLLGFVRERTRSVIAGFVIHATINCVGAIGYYVAQR